MTSGTRKLGRRQNSSIWSFLDVFVGYSTQFLGSGFDFTTSDPGYTKNVMSSKLVDLVISGSFWAIAHSFWLRGRFQRLVTSGTRKLGCRKNSLIWSFLAVFVGYSTQFLALGTISTVGDPGYTKIGMPSKLVDLVIFGRFRGI